MHRTLNLSQASMLFLPLSIAATGFESDRVRIATTRKMATAGVAKENEVLAFKQPQLRCFRSNSRKQGIYV